MYFLIRKLTGGADAEAVDSEYSGDRLVLGASDNAAVVLPGLTGEIVVSGKGDGACTVTGRGLQLRLDGSEVARATLPVGGEVNAGDYLLRVLDPPAGFDVALQLETETALSDSATRASQSVDKAPFSLRAVSWSLVLLIIIPHIDMFLISIRERVAVRTYETGFANYLTFFTEPLYLVTFIRTAVMSVLATAMTLIIAFPVSYYIAKIAKGRLQSALFLLCLVPFWVSELVRTFGWMILLRETGIFSNLLQFIGIVDGPVEMLYNDTAMMVGLIYTSMLFMVVPLVTTLESLDDSVIEAGYDLGGNAVTVTREIVIPHAIPGIVSGCIVVFMLSLGNYLTPTMLGGKESLWFTELIYSQFIVRFNWELGAAFGFLLLGLSSFIVWIALRLTGQTLEKTMG